MYVLTKDIITESSGQDTRKDDNLLNKFDTIINSNNTANFVKIDQKTELFASKNSKSRFSEDDFAKIKIFLTNPIIY